MKKVLLAGLFVGAAGFVHSMQDHSLFSVKTGNAVVKGVGALAATEFAHSRIAPVKSSAGKLRKGLDATMRYGADAGAVCTACGNEKVQFIGGSTAVTLTLVRRWLNGAAQENNKLVQLPNNVARLDKDNNLVANGTQVNVNQLSNQ